jgi:hypothetical protein
MQTGERLLCSNSKAPGRIIKIGESENGRSAQIIFITLLLSCNSLYQPQQSVHKCLAQNHFCWAKSTCFNFSSSDFYLHGHILTTTGVALTKRDRPPQWEASKKSQNYPHTWGGRKATEILLSNRFYKHTRFYYKTTLKQGSETRKWLCSEVSP